MAVPAAFWRAGSTSLRISCARRHKAWAAGKACANGKLTLSATAAIPRRLLTDPLVSGQDTRRCPTLLNADPWRRRRCRRLEGREAAGHDERGQLGITGKPAGVREVGGRRHGPAG